MYKNCIYTISKKLLKKIINTFDFFFRMKPGASRVPKPGEPNNAPTKKEVVYPFGVQNDLGHVVLTRNSKVSYIIKLYLFFCHTTLLIICILTSGMVPKKRKKKINKICTVCFVATHTLSCAHVT